MHRKTVVVAIIAVTDNLSIQCRHSFATRAVSLMDLIIVLAIQIQHKNVHLRLSSSL